MLKNILSMLSEKNIIKTQNKIFHKNIFFV